MEKIKQPTQTKIFAHRGASGLVDHENTLEAFQKAMDVGSDGIELDIRKTKDEIIIINHNPDADGMLICDYTYEELCNHTAKLGYQMPTLESVLALCAGKIFLDFELKEGGYEEKIIDTITNYLNINDFFVRSFFPEVIKKIKEINPYIKTALLIGEHLPKRQWYRRFFEVFPNYYIKKTSCDIISPFYKLLLFGYTKRMHKKGILVSIWTVNNQEAIKKALKLQVDYIITNYPDVAIRLRNEKSC